MTEMQTRQTVKTTITREKRLEVDVSEIAKALGLPPSAANSVKVFTSATPGTPGTTSTAAASSLLIFEWKETEVS